MLYSEEPAPIIYSGEPAPIIYSRQPAPIKYRRGWDRQSEGGSNPTKVTDWAQTD